MSDSTPPASSTFEFYSPVEIGATDRPGQRYWLHGLLLLATIFTMLVTGAGMNYNFTHGAATFSVAEGGLKLTQIVRMFHHPAQLLGGLPFALTLMVILLCHEMGHYLYCVYYGVDATLPYFIPFPSADRNPGRIHPHQGVHSFAIRVV